MTDLRALAERAAREIRPMHACSPLCQMCAEAAGPIERAIRQAVEAEREACANEAERHYLGGVMPDDPRYCCRVEEKIRARGGKS